MDPDLVELKPPLPDGAQGGAVTFYAVRGGVLPGWTPAARTEATHARIELRGQDGETTSREVAADEAEAFLAEVARMHDSEAAEPAAEVDLTCPHCGIPRHHEGPAVKGAYEEYACPRCGSVALFRAGRVEHPLPDAPAED